MPINMKGDPLKIVTENPGYPMLWSSRDLWKFLRILQKDISADNAAGLFQLGVDEARSRAWQMVIATATVTFLAIIAATGFLAAKWDRQVRRFQREQVTTNQELLDEVRLSNFMMLKFRAQAPEELPQEQE